MDPATITVLLIVVLSLISGWVCARCLHDPYYDLHAPKAWDVEIPDLTFDSRGFA